MSARSGQWLRDALSLRLYRVRGDSMLPTLESGCWLLVNIRKRRPEVGRIVIARDPERLGAILVKRVGSSGHDRVALMSDNLDEGRDSRHFGAVSSASVVGTVVARLPFLRANKRHPAKL